MKEEYVKYPRPSEIYRHYKGGEYVILTLAQHTETNEPLVVYQSTLFGSIYARPLSMWFETVDDGKQQRFVKTK
jgi:hypothetical protein